jgi:hypothetical protein
MIPISIPNPSSTPESIKNSRCGVRAGKANVACKNAIEEAIRRDFDGMHLKESCAQSVIAEFGYKRVNLVLANNAAGKER